MKHLSIMHCFAIRTVVFLGLLAGPASAQGTRLDLAAGPAARDVGSIESTDRWGGQLRLGLLARGTSHIAIHVAISATGFGGPGATPTGVATPASSSGGIGGLGAVAATLGLRWHADSSHTGGFAGIDGGTIWLDPGNAATQWHGLIGAEVGYQRTLTHGRAVFAEVRYDYLAGVNGSPRWMTPILVGVSWAVGR